jgi:hypothetical protein
VPIELSAELITLETAAWTQIQTGTLTVDTAHAVHAAVVAHAEASGESRLAVEEAVKRAVRHPEAGA